ncbi:hypothetical protein [Campylobacter sp. IFREMER_LSEM_CL2194]|uniref:hypothetical protein n=1 Tax=Campylobacter sp. IFREMER_LSEM_CL2194 TaxID=2911621 RepID=UPI0021E8BB76|nr:hypothetical protein [Campylobacter sp. IFREMER_LSEM_CL2194]MCV3377052.1 hypothetical protein [Campylobacter sp. IFREMER_LSEM_CL2194]
MKKLAIHLFGHLRTYEMTCKSFYDNIVNPNIKDGWKIDIFIHTWDTLSSSVGSWHRGRHDFDERKLTKIDIDKLYQIYHPKKISIETLEKEYGLHITVRRVNELREEYEKQNNINYDYVLFTRPDIIFFKEFRLSYYLDLYSQSPLKNIGLPEKFIMCASRILENFPLYDPRWTPANDILWFTKASNFCVPNAEDKDKIKIYLKYRIGIECDIKRLVGYECSREKDHIVNFKITQLNQDQSKISLRTKYGTAKARIQNQLSYKLGQAMIINSKSILGYIRMPFVLSYIKDKHKQEQKNYQEKIKKDPSLALPPLESYPDYKEALKEKECLTYKLGQALIQANKTWYGGGYIKLLFEIRKLKKQS